MDRLDSAERSRLMSRIRGRNTSPEIALRRALHVQGLRFRIHTKGVPGTPDIAHKTTKVAVFVDGCFWHGCPEHYRRPQSRQDFWDRKLAYNLDLRQRVKARLRNLDWKVVELWECRIKRELGACVRKVARTIDSRRPQQPLK